MSANDHRCDHRCDRCGDPVVVLSLTDRLSELRSRVWPEFILGVTVGDAVLCRECFQLTAGGGE